ncbi:MAG: hypothetical protein V3S19_01435, partial [Gemmatimonadales bacterium]
ADLMPLAWIPLLMAALVLLGQTVTRRTASLVGLAALLLRPMGVSAQLVTGAERSVRDSALGKASEAYLVLARRGFAEDTSYYNAGTTAIMAGKLEAATVPLTRAATSVDPDLRFRALYNLGTAALKTSRVDTARAEALREVAIQHLKEALLLHPGSAEAKWNLELALRAEPPPSDGGGGGGQSAPPPPSGQEDQPEADPQPVPDGLTQSQAEQILNSIERQERATRANQQKRRRGRGAGGGKDW